MKTVKKNNILYILLIFLILLISILLISKITTKQEGKLIETNYKEIQKKADNKDSFILLVSQSTCSHCAEYKPILQNIAKNYNLNIYYIDYDTDKNGEKFLKEYNLNGSTPMTIFIDKGTEKSLLNRLSGSVSEEKTISTFKKMGFIKSTS